MVDINNKQVLPLEGLVVLDFTRLLPGPLCTMLMGDYGAEVVKIEDLHAGDPTRFVGRFFDGSGAFYSQLNRNKKSIAIDLKKKQGREITTELAKKADVVIEGFRPGVMERLGLDYKNLEQINKRLVYASVTGYGQEGPYRDRAGHDLNYEALSGLLDLSAGKNSGPQMPAVQSADIIGGTMMALSGTMMALYQRERTGQGSYIDLAMTRGLLPGLTLAATALNSGEDTARRGSSGQVSGGYACYNLYETADGKYMSLAALEPVFWHRFCLTAGHPEWTELQYDQERRLKMIEEVGRLFKKKTRSEWIEIFSDVDACCEPVLTLEEAVEHPLNHDSSYWIKTETGKGEIEIMPGFPILFSGRGGRVRLDPPRHGEHTRMILEKL
ncbi:MAG: CaiB/BaiF CoA transferase family protein, partial [Bacillota bacterium]